MVGSGKHRPKEVGPWEKSGRIAEPVIKNAEAFGQEWLKWYTELQPASRKDATGGLHRAIPDNTNWNELSKGTVNGIYSLIASLGWWLNAIETSKGSKVEVLKAISDINWSLAAMIRAQSAKCASEGPDDGTRFSKKRRV